MCGSKVHTCRHRYKFLLAIVETVARVSRYIISAINPIFLGEQPRMSDFGRELGLLIPRLRRYARALTRDVNRADDLVQECLVRALAKQHLFQPGTDLRAWLFTLLHNQHVTEIRRAAPFGNPAEVDGLAPVAVEGNAIPSVELKDLERAIAKLPIEQRQAVLLVGLEGMPYDEVASVLHVPIG